MASVEDEQPSSSSSTFSEEEVNKLLSQGKRHFVCDEVVEAVKCFEAACLMMSQKYGVLANECGDVHFQYGKGLLELARLESGVLGSALQEAVEEEIESADEENNMDTDGQVDASAKDNSMDNKQSSNNETIAKGNTAEKPETDEEKPASAKAEGSSAEKMDEDTIENNTVQEKSKDNIEEGEKKKDGAEKPTNEGTGESTDEKMAEDTTGENKTGDESTDDQKRNVEDNASEDKEGCNKECMSEERKEVDEAVGEVERKEDVGKKEDTEGQKEETQGKKECTEGDKEGTEGYKEGTEGDKEGTEGDKMDTQGQKDDTVGQKDDEKTTGQQNGKDVTKESKDTDKKDEDVDVDEATEDGPVSTIQLAWESLELARIIFKRQSNAEIQLKLAQTHLLLGEIHMEQEQFTDAVSELTKCLNIQKNLLKPDDRLLAETYYNLGLAYTLSMMYDESANHYGNAAEVLELRLTNIKARIEEAEQQDKGKGKASDDDPLVKDRKEVAELEDLLPEIKEKGLDAKNESERLKSNIKEKLGLTSIGVGSTSPFTSTCPFSAETAKPANDISHLVRKQKRKSKETGESNENAEAPAKKLRQDGDSSTTTTENGDSTTTGAGVENTS